MRPDIIGERNCKQRFDNLDSHPVVICSTENIKVPIGSQDAPNFHVAANCEVIQFKMIGVTHPVLTSTTHDEID